MGAKPAGPLEVVEQRPVEVPDHVVPPEVRRAELQEVLGDEPPARAGALLDHPEGAQNVRDRARAVVAEHHAARRGHRLDGGERVVHLVADDAQEPVPRGALFFAAHSPQRGEEDEVEEAEYEEEDGAEEEEEGEEYDDPLLPLLAPSDR